MYLKSYVEWITTAMFEWKVLGAIMADHPLRGTLSPDAH